MAPCQFMTPGLRKSFAIRNSIQKTYGNLDGQYSVGRVGESEEIVGPALFLASDASSMVTERSWMWTGAISRDDQLAEAKNGASSFRAGVRTGWKSGIGSTQPVEVDRNLYDGSLAKGGGGLARGSFDCELS